MTDNTETASVSSTTSLSKGDKWPYHYRGYGLSVNPSGEVWWQAYNGTDRLQFDPTPDDLVENFLEVKRNGGAIRVTEAGRVITKREVGTSLQDYETIYVGDLNFEGELVPPEKSGHAVPISPDGLSPGDLWPSIYDGSKYSFCGDRFWWQDGGTNLRHPFAESLPQQVVDELKRLRPEGGSFQITPNGDVLTQIPTVKTPSDVREQFRDLPQTVKRILQFRRDRGNVDMVPVYVGQLKERPIEVEEPTRLTDPLSEQEAASLEAWASAMGSYEETELREEDHQFGNDETREGY